MLSAILVECGATLDLLGVVSGNVARLRGDGVLTLWVCHYSVCMGSLRVMNLQNLQMKMLVVKQQQNNKKKLAYFVLKPCATRASVVEHIERR